MCDRLVIRTRTPVVEEALGFAQRQRVADRGAAETGEPRAQPASLHADEIRVDKRCSYSSRAQEKQDTRQKLIDKSCIEQTNEFVLSKERPREILKGGSCLRPLTVSWYSLEYCFHTGSLVSFEPNQFI